MIQAFLAMSIFDLFDSVATRVMLVLLPGAILRTFL